MVPVVGTLATVASAAGTGARIYVGHSTTERRRHRREARVRHMRRNFRGTDRGKRVVAADGSAVGTIVGTDGERARVLLDPERSEPGDPRSERGARTTVTIDRASVAESTNDRVHLADGADPSEASRPAKDRGGHDGSVRSR